MSHSFLLARHPHVLLRLREEISDVMGEEGVLNGEHIQKLRWLKCVLNEIKRSLERSIFRANEDGDSQ